MILFDWGTYNSLHTLTKAATLGMKLTEIPPADLSRKSRTPEYFSNYKEFSSKAFTTVTAHAPYYNVVSYSSEVRRRVLKAMKAALRRAYEGGAQVFNMHLGWKVFGGDKDIEMASEFIKELLKDAPQDIYISIETTYTRRQLGSLDDIKAIIEHVGGERVIASLQLENIFMYELGIDEHGNFHKADKQADTSFWLNILKKALPLSKGFLSLRFSQVTGLYFGRRLLKKRVPLGKGYPSLGVLADALARFIVREVHDKSLPLKMHLIYTGVPETKYEDSIALYAEIMKRVVPYLEK